MVETLFYCQSLSEIVYHDQSNNVSVWGVCVCAACVGGVLGVCGACVGRV